ncbi:permease prefix domain 1-containing protein [Pseudalkalibacillus decolorationis]|uniref:permease prefix domain 1-containing protein n=1 Tax=Pseudalkalibacillus decolorationis TaxID=163879 RepID=UPI002149848A|nr:permease prefix domain 1-containing protein [Pseudalkalibacillus decolorationis]
MREIKNHVDELFKKIPDSEQKELIKQEILENLEEKVADLMAQGKKEEDAINRTIVEFGDIEEIEKELGVSQPTKKNMTKFDLGFSILGSALIISLFVFINFYYTPKTIWFVYPTFAVLWWPLSMYYRWLRQ